MPVPRKGREVYVYLHARKLNAALQGAEMRLEVARKPEHVKGAVLTASTSSGKFVTTSTHALS